MFDQLLLLSPHGEMVYFGDIGDNGSTLLEYCSQFGFEMEPERNPADFALEFSTATNRLKQLQLQQEDEDGEGQEEGEVEQVQQQQQQQQHPQQNQQVETIEEFVVAFKNSEKYNNMWREIEETDQQSSSDESTRKYEYSGRYRFYHIYSPMSKNLVAF